MIYFLYFIYFLYPFWFLGLRTTDDGIIYGILFLVHSGYIGLFTVIAVYMGDMYSSIINMALFILVLWCYQTYLI